MTNLIDAPFEAWLAHLPALGYDRLWIGNNLPALRKRFQEDPGTRMPECPTPPERARDRYEEL
jgi:hypothetical protein